MEIASLLLGLDPTLNLDVKKAESLPRSAF